MGRKLQKLFAISKFVVMINFPGCKINLGLRILRKRADGYHDIESVFFPVPLNDIVEVVKAPSNSPIVFSASGLEIPGDISENLCVKAYHLLQSSYALSSVSIHLHKEIPMGAGLGGGSADGTSTLFMLNELFNLKLTDEKLEGFALQLGSDCPFFVKNQPALVEGRGEKIKPVSLSLKGYFLVLINDGTHISTQEAYAGVHPKEPDISLEKIIQLPVIEWKNKLINDFEDTVFKKHQQLKEIKRQLYKKGAEYAAMTGSGSTIFGLFKHKPSFEEPKSGFIKIIGL